MNQRPLINLDRSISEIGLGCASYWGNKRFSERQAVAVVHAALDHGITYFDTGHSYSGGYAEARLGRALASSQVSRDGLLISSKAGTRVGNYGRLCKDFSPEWLRRSCEQSLRDLGLGQLPVFYLHGPNPEDFNDDVFGLLESLKAEGKIGLVGVNAFDDHIIKLTVESGQFQCLMPDFNILRPERIPQLAKWREQGFDVFVAGALAGGLYDQRFKQFRGLKSIWYWLRAWKNNRHQLRQAKTLAFLNNHPEHAATQLALAYVLQQPHFSSALLGTTSVAHLTELAGVSAADLGADWAQRIGEQQNTW
ncbi:aldo/keto reductase [Marinicella sediminis]|uniref:Aldo/keto reductase n=1 Tax=Marinicella sediminis TaxID=1792834 RepID=A0ABV7JA27_9GAMM|nr:aldo/keto reductase [Marinicella sediminis]